MKTPTPHIPAGRRPLLVALVAVVLLVLPARAATIYSFAIDTTIWSGQSATLAFDLIGGDAAMANNTASVSALATDGSLGDATPFTVTDFDFFNEVLRDITFGTTLSFTLELTEQHAAPGFDQFSFFVLDPSTLLPLLGTTDPLGADALFAIDITGAPGGSALAFEAVAPGTSWNVEYVPSPAGVPDAGATLALMLALWLVFAVARENGVRRFARP